MRIFQHPEFENHEQVVFCRDAASGLSAIISVHNTNLGPAAGGCRMWSYLSEEDALTDALRLSKAMTYKNALAGLALGGGKSVIIGDARKDKNPKLLKAFAKFVQRLGGTYNVAEDVGIRQPDVELMAKDCDFVFGLEEYGDPSPATSRGVFQGVRAVVKQQFKTDDLHGIKVAVQGVGAVGMGLCKHLHDAGAKLFVTDINTEAVNHLVTHFNATAVDLEKIHALDVDVYAPCALGGTLNDVTIPQIKAKAIAGAANNQLKEPRHGEMLREAGILYSPDYIINSGGMIFAANGIFKIKDEENALNKVDAIYNTLLSVFEKSTNENKPTSVIADEMAEAIIYNKKEPVLEL